MLATTMTYRIHIGDGGCQGDEHIHVRRTVPERLEGRHVELEPSHHLKQEGLKH